MWTGISYNKRYPFCAHDIQQTECSSILSLSSGKSRKIPLHFAFWSFSQNSWIIFRIKSEPRPLDNAHPFPRCNIAKYYTAKAYNTLYKQKEKAFVPSCTKAAAAHIPHGQMPFPVVRKKEWKKVVKKCWQEGGGMVLYLSAKRWGKRMTSKASAGSPWKEPIDAEKFRFVLRNFLAGQVQKVQKLLKNKAWQKTTSVVK